MGRRVFAFIVAGAGCGGPPTPAAAPPPAQRSVSMSAPAHAPAVRTARYPSRALPDAQFTDPDRARKLRELVPRLEQRVDEFFARHDPPSLAVAMVADGRTVFTRVLGVRDRASKAPATEQTLYRIGSITKTFTATVVLSLRDAGLLRLDESAEGYLPELANVVYPYRDAPRFTLRHLLTHTSGLPRLGDFDYTRSDRDVTEAEMLAALERTSLQRAPGTTPVYSNYGVSLLGSLIARQAPEASFRAAVAKRITEPLGMTRTTFDPATLASAEPATGYATHADQEPAASWRLGASEASGGLWSTLPDMARWIAAQLAAWPARAEPEGGRVSRASLREAHTPAVALRLEARLGAGGLRASARSVGLAWHTRQTCAYERIVEHDGGIDGFSASVAFAPERGFGFAVLASSLDTPAPALTETLLEEAEKMLLPREPVPAARTTQALTKLASTIGTCADADYETLFTASFRQAVPLAIRKRVCNDLFEVHGTCTLGRIRKVDGPYQGAFELSCERGAIEASVHVQEVSGQGVFSGLLLRSTGFVPTEPAVRAATALLSLHSSRGDAALRSLFSPNAAENAWRTELASARRSFGQCRLATRTKDARTGNGARGAVLPLACERGGAVELAIDVDERGKVVAMQFVNKQDPAARCDDGR